MNCTIVAAKEGPMTLQQIGDIFGVTRMRICQLEKKILKKISNIEI
jgi:DNA-directed RNA polymerase sigma subunit (sigma70/sigma32)